MLSYGLSTFLTILIQFFHSLTASLELLSWHVPPQGLAHVTLNMLYIEKNIQKFRRLFTYTKYLKSIYERDVSFHSAHTK